MGAAGSEILSDKEHRLRAQRLLEGENEVLKLIVERAPLSTILTQLTRVAEQQGSPGLLSSILLLDDDGLHLRHGAAPSLPDSYNHLIDGIEIGPSVGSCGTAAYRRQEVVVSDIANDPLWADFRDLAALHGLRACWSTPIVSSRGQVLGTFALYYRQPSTPTAEERSVIQILTRTAALAIENKAAERNLAASEERFRILSRCSPVGIFTLDTEGTFTYVNPRFQEISGYTFEKTFEYWLESAAEPAVRQRAVSQWRDAAAKWLEFETEIPVVADSGRRVVKLRAAPMSSAGKSHIGYVGTIEDISERLRVETDLRTQSAFREAIEESLPCGIAVVDVNGRQSYVNHAFAQMVDWPADALIGASPPFVYWPAEELPSIQNAFRSTLDGHDANSAFELRFQRRSGERFDVLVTLAALRDATHTHSGWVASVLDITEQKRAKRVLADSEARLGFALDAGSMGAWEYDIATGRVTWSPQLEALHGLAPGAFPGTLEAVQSDMNPEHRARVLATIEQAIRARGPYRVEYEIIRPDGSRRWVEARGKVVLDDCGEPARMIGICMDVTDRH